MARTKFIFMIVLIVMAIIVIYYLNCFDKDREENFTEGKSFEKLTQYKTESVSDNLNIDNILNNIELSQYISKVEKKSEFGKEQLTIYYDCTIEAEVKEYWKNANKNSVTEENSVILFSLIDKLDRIKYQFSVSNEELKKRFPYLSEDITREYDREEINLMYNQDVRNFANNPDEFLKYNMDLNTNQITIYKMDYFSEDSKYDKFELREEEVNKIKEFIEEQNFGIDYEPIEGMIDIIIDFHNDYVIEIYADSNNAIISKANIEDIINNVNNSTEQVCKTIPSELREYVNSLTTL